MGLLKPKDSELAAKHIRTKDDATLREINRRIQDRQDKADKKKR